uniref:Uncharacterized protein n=1 Tax=Solanum lycopersicum TaxID=4081 RepID=A0A3Q7HZ03_SOLLC
MRSLLFEGGSSFAFAWWSSSHLLVSVPVSLLEGGMSTCFPFFVSFSSVSLVSSSKGSLAVVSLLEPLDFSASEFSRRCWFWEHFGH